MKKISTFGITVSLVLCALMPLAPFAAFVHAQTVDSTNTALTVEPQQPSQPAENVAPEPATPTALTAMPALEPTASVGSDSSTPQVQPQAEPVADPQKQAPQPGPQSGGSAQPAADNPAGPDQPNQPQPLLGGGGDTTSPWLVFVLWNDIDHSNTFTFGDQFSFLFSEPMATSTISENDENVDERLGLSNSHTFGSVFQDMVANWDPSGSVLNVYLGMDATVQNGDTVNPTSEVTDLAGNPDATPQNIVLTTGQTVTHTISASAGGGGSISPQGTVQVNDGASQTFTITPNSDFQISDVLVDGSSVGSTTSYTFATVTADHTIAATFTPTGGGNRPPVITILGDNPMTVIQNTPFNDPGATATDTEDGDLSADIQNSGIVHVETIGTYVKIYTVTDSGGLSDTKTRIVNVVMASSTNPTNPHPARHRHGGTTAGGYVGSLAPAVLGAEFSIYDLRAELAKIIQQNRQLFMILQSQGYKIPQSIMNTLNSSSAGTT